MKIKLMLVGIALMFTTRLCAQNALDVPTLTSVLPAPPNATELTKYSGVPINLSSGSANVSIPLGELKSGRLSLPISLSYSSGNGIKIDQTASRTGMGWVLNAGGVVTRSVAGNPDETTIFRKVPPLLTADSDSTLKYLKEATSGLKAYDTEPDVFSFNFNGYSGQFILNQARNNVISLSPTPLKIATNFSGALGDWTIKITDPAGTNYYFGGSEATETTHTSPYGGGCGKNYDDPIPTAWYMTSMVSYNGNTISFGYEPVTFDYYAGVSETLIETPASTFLKAYSTMNTNNIFFVVDPANPPTIDFNYCPDKTDYKVCGSLLRCAGVRLSTIIADFTAVDIAYTSRTDIVGDYLVSGITFSSAAGTQKTYSLTYTNSNNALYINPVLSSSDLQTRPFLTKITGPTTEEHIIHYYGMDLLPARLSFSQDYWGYYNGKYNAKLTPKHSNNTISSIFPSTMANREPDGTKSFYGLLSRITYPSGGNDSLIYEPNTVYENRLVIPASTQSLTIQGSGSSIMEIDELTFNSVASQNITFNFTCDYDGVSVNDGIHQHSIFELYNAANILVYTKQLDPGQNFTTIQALSMGDYTVKLKSYGAASIGTVTFNVPAHYAFNNYEVGGVRVAKNISTPGVGNVLTKKIVYAALGSQANSSGKLRYRPNPDDYYADQPVFMQDDANQCDCISGSSSSKVSLNYFSGSHIYYQDVIELKSDTWEDGGIAHHYIGSEGLEPVTVRGALIPGVSVANYGMDAGTETNVKVFKTTGGSAGAYTTATVNDVTTHYKMDTRLTREVEVYTVRKKWDPLFNNTPISWVEFLPYDVSKTTLVRQWHYPDTVTTTSYDANGTNPIITKQIFLYNDTTHLQVNEVKTINSDTSKTIIKFKYPAEMVAAGTTNPYSSMLSQNRLALPVIKSKYLDTAFVESVITNYAAFTGSIIEPASMQYKQGWNTPGDYVEFTNYDSEGKLLTQSLKYGAKVSYKYGYSNKLVIAECKNALVTEFYHKNFEDTTATTGAAHTGKKYYTGDYTVTWYPPSGGRAYRLSYWYLDGSVWKLQEQAYTGTSATLTLGSAIDDICIFPVDAMMKTYTYDPAVGITSMIDEKGLTAYFEYDDHQRLLNVKDKDGNILKNYKYHLAN